MGMGFMDCMGMGGRCYHSEANAERALDGRSLPPNVDIQTRPKTHEHTPNDSQHPTDIPPVTVTVTVGMIIAVTIVHTSVPSAAALPPQRIALMRRANAYQHHVRTRASCPDRYQPVS